MRSRARTRPRPVLDKLANSVSGLCEEPPVDWASGPPAEVRLSCGCMRLYRPPSPAKGDVITCGTCGRPVVVELPVRRSDRHAPRMSRAELLGRGVLEDRPGRYVAVDTMRLSR